MPELAHAETRAASDVVRSVPVLQAENGLCYAAFGDTRLSAEELRRLLDAVPAGIASALSKKAYYFVPLTLTDNGEVRVSENYSEALGDVSSCHRNYEAGESQYIFISTRLSPDRFSVAFELFINVAHAFVDMIGVSPEFAEVVWQQALDNVKGETSLDAYESRRMALGVGNRDQFIGTETGARDERAKSEFLEAAFADSIAIYMLSLAMDVEYFELRERDYPLLAPKALAGRLEKIATLFPANPGYDFAVHYRRRMDH